MGKRRVVLLLLAFAFALCGSGPTEAWAKKKDKDVKIIRASETQYKKVKVVRAERIQKKRFFWQKKETRLVEKSAAIEKKVIAPAEAKAKKLAIEAKPPERKKSAALDSEILSPAELEADPAAAAPQRPEPPVTRPREAGEKAIVDPEPPAAGAAE